MICCSCLAWLEQKERNIADRRDQEEVYAAGSSIGGNLKLLAERRTDIFGSGAEEAQIGKPYTICIRTPSGDLWALLQGFLPSFMCVELFEYNLCGPK